MRFTRKKKTSIKKRHKLVIRNKRTIKKRNKKTVKKMVGGGIFDDAAYNVSRERADILIDNVSGINIATMDDTHYKMIGKSTTLLHNIYLQNMIENIINDVNCSNNLTLFIKSLKSMPEKTNYLSKDVDYFLHYYIYNELLNKYEGDDIMDCMILDGSKEYDTNYSVSNYKFLFNYNLCDLYVNYAFEQLMVSVTEYNLKNSASKITYFDDTTNNLYNSPTFYNIYDVNDLKKVISILDNEIVGSKLKTYFYSVDYKNSKFEELALYLNQITGYIFDDVKKTKIISEKSRTILTFINKIQGIIEQSRAFQPPSKIGIPSPRESPPSPQTPQLITKEQIYAFFSDFNEKSETHPETVMSTVIMRLITISGAKTIDSEISKFERLLNIKLDQSAKSTLIDLIQQYQNNIYGSNNNSVYFSAPVSFYAGGSKSAPTTSAMNDMKTELAKKHVVYDNAHDFDYGIYEGYSPLCKDLCDYSIVERSDAIKTYKEHYGGTSIVGTDSTIKSHIWNLTFDKFIPYLATVDFKFDSKNQSAIIKEIQKYIRKEILQIDDTSDLYTSKVAFHHDMGGFFTELMIKGKLALSTDNDDAKDKATKNSKNFVDLHNSTLLKAWDSSTGGFNIGNKTIKDYVLSNEKNKSMTALIAYNLQSLTAMVKYFAIDYYNEVVQLFNNKSSQAYIPVLQSTSLNKTEFVVELYLVNIDTAREIYEFIKSKYDEYKTKTSADFIKRINDENLFDIAGRLSVAYKNTGGQKIYRLSSIYYPQKKYSVNSILKALNLPINIKRSGNPNKDSIKSLQDLLDYDVLKNNLTGINRNKYLFMLKHSGDTCQGIQTGLAFDVFNLVLKDSGMSFANSILYTEDALAFCNAVFNGNNVMTITAKNNVVSIHHTRKTVTLESFASSVNKIYEHLSEAESKTSPTYKSEVAYFNNIINVINKKSNNELSSDEVIELIKRISEYNDYFSLKMVFDELKKESDKQLVANVLYGGIIDFGRYETYFDFNSIYLLAASKDLTGKDLTTNKLRFNKFINTYKTLNQITVERVESVYKTLDSSGKNNNLIALQDKLNKTKDPPKNSDTIFYEQFNIMFDDIVENSSAAWVENIFKNMLTSFNNDLIELLVHVKELKEQYNKVDKLKVLVSSKDKIHSLLNTYVKNIDSKTDFNSIIDAVFTSRLNLYKKELKDEMNYEGTRKTNSKVEFVATNKVVKYNLNINVFKLIKCIKKLKETDKINGSKSFDTIYDIVQQIDAAFL